MPGFLSTLSDEDLKRVAEYYAAQRPTLRSAKRRVWLYSAP
jgi:cytochrome c553